MISKHELGHSVVLPVFAIVFSFHELHIIVSMVVMSKQVVSNFERRLLETVDCIK